MDGTASSETNISLSDARAQKMPPPPPKKRLYLSSIAADHLRSPFTIPIMHSVHGLSL